MAKPIVLVWEGREHSFDLKKLERKDLYPSKKRLPLTSEGSLCKRGQCDQSGMVIESGMLSQGYFDPQGDWVERSALVNVDAAGQEKEPAGSTLGVPVPAEGPVDPRRALSLLVSSVYMLEPADVAPELLERIAGGQMLEFGFNYSAGPMRYSALLAGNEHGYFALIGQFAQAAAAGVSQAASAEEEESEMDEEDLDFDMF